MTCDCIAEMDAKLAEHNTRIAVTFGFPRNGAPSFTRPTIQTEKIESRRRGGSALALPTFCPFCGDRYESAQTIADEELVRRAIGRLASRSGGIARPLWACVADLFALGSTYASQLCRTHGFDPDQEARS